MTRRRRTPMANTTSLLPKLKSCGRIDAAYVLLMCCDRDVCRQKVLVDLVLASTDGIATASGARSAACRTATNCSGDPSEGSPCGFDRSCCRRSNCNRIKLVDCTTDVRPKRQPIFERVPPRCEAGGVRRNAYQVRCDDSDARRR